MKPYLIMRSEEKVIIDKVRGPMVRRKPLGIRCLPKGRNTETERYHRGLVDSVTLNTIILRSIHGILRKREGHYPLNILQNITKRCKKTRGLIHSLLTVRRTSVENPDLVYFKPDILRIRPWWIAGTHFDLNRINSSTAHLFTCNGGRYLILDYTDSSDWESGGWAASAIQGCLKRGRGRVAFTSNQHGLQAERCCNLAMYRYRSSALELL
jgi:hypothetical protein